MLKFTDCIKRLGYSALEQRKIVFDRSQVRAVKVAINTCIRVDFLRHTPWECSSSPNPA